jgi:RNA polymerase sigma-70 factor (ECF subfamily)
VSFHLPTDDKWVADISDSGQVREMALADLRATLVAGLNRAFRQSAVGSTLIEDAAQEALLRIVDRIHTFRGDSRFVTWAMAIATRAMLSQLRQAHWKDVSLDEMAAAGLILPSAAIVSKDDNLDWLRLLEVVRAATESDLTGRQRQAILAELAGVPPEVIAERMGSNRNAVYKLVHDARTRLRRAILASGWTESSVRSVLKGF